VQEGYPFILWKSQNPLPSLPPFPNLPSLPEIRQYALVPTKNQSVSCIERYHLDDTPDADTKAGLHQWCQVEIDGPPVSGCGDGDMVVRSTRY
jgi:hypothetical protein